jgi:polysaccharide pyruvyl transferase WcaK-like protein
VKHSCVLWGGYGHGNVGDDLTLAVALADARRAWGDSVAILTPRADRTARQFPDIPRIPYVLRRPPPPARLCLRARAALRSLCGGSRGGSPRYRLRDQLPAGSRAPRPAWVRAVEEARELVLVGGGYLTDLFPVETFLFPVQLARAKGVPVRTDPLGIGPFASRRAAAAVVAALLAADLRVRDDVSLEFCRAHGLAAKRCLDSGFRLKEVVPALVRAPRGRRVGICISRQAGSGPGAARRATTAWCNAFLRALAADRDLEIRGFCFHADPRTDYEATRAAFLRAGIDADLVAPPCADFREAARALASHNVIVTTRFHAAVAAAALAIPCFAFARGSYYAAKMASVRAQAPETTVIIDPAGDPSERAATIVRAAARDGEAVAAGRRENRNTNG